MLRFHSGPVGRPNALGGLDLQAVMNISQKEKRFKVGSLWKIAFPLQCTETEHSEECETGTHEEQNDEELESLSTTLPPQTWTVGNPLLLDVDRRTLSGIIEMHNLDQRPGLDDERCRHVLGLRTIG